MKIIGKWKTSGQKRGSSMNASTSRTLTRDLRERERYVHKYGR